MFDLGKVAYKEILTVTFTLFAIIDMLGNAPVLISLKAKMGGKIRTWQATAASGALMIVFLYVGQEFLNLMGLDVRSFAVAGSIVIFIIALEMVLGIEFIKGESNPKAGSVVPIAFPLIAGSGTLTTIMSLKANFETVNILIGILINCVIIFLVLGSLKWLEKALGPNGLIVVRKFFGIILLAIAVKIFGTNVQNFGK